MTNHSNYQKATLGSGCFWCTEAIFQDLEGVIAVESGYAGGHVENPTYTQVCTKTTGHVEVIQITFDPKQISYEDLLEIFWATHDPTTPNRQGDDIGPQYRSAIFYHNDAQKAIAEASKKALEDAGVWKASVFTQISQINNYYPAEDLHQNYYKKVGDRNPYCIYVISPKLQKFKKLFRDRLKAAS